MTKYFDTDQVELKNGDIIDLGQTVNGCRTFLINCLELLDVRYYPNTTLKYEYDVNDLLSPSKLLGHSEFKIIERDSPLLLPGGGVRGILTLENLKYIEDKTKAKEELLKAMHTVHKNSRQVEEISKQLSQIPFEKFSVEKVESNTVKFTLVIKQSLILTVIKPLDKVEDLEDNEVIFNLYRNRELLISNVTKIENLVKGLNNFINERESDQEENQD